MKDSVSSADVPTSSESEKDPLLGQTFDGRYRLDEVLGEGGVGRVYRATHLALERPVALKVLLAQHADKGESKARFIREAKTLAALRHPHIVSVVDYGVEPVPFLVLELVEGEELEDWIQRGPLPIRVALDLFEQLLRALAYAHEAGIVHRDLKPSNLFVRSLPGGGVHLEVLDFGLAKFNEADEPETKANFARTATKVTQAGQILGTPAYMSPEQVSGGRCEAGSDLYSATIVLYEMLTGELPYEAADLSELLRAHLIQPHRPVDQWPSSPPMSPSLVAFVDQGLAKKSSDRWLLARDALDGLQSLPERASSGVTATVRTPGRPSGTHELVARAQELKKKLSSWKATTETRLVAVPPKVLLRVIGGLVALVLVLVIAMSFGEEEEPASTPSASATSAVPSMPVGAETPTANPSTDGDFWEGLTGQLASAKARLDRGRRLSRRQLGSLRMHARNHPEDIRATLLHARAYMVQGWLSHALPLYQEAYAKDPRATQDPTMLAALVRMAETEAVGEEAAALLTQAFGARAKPALREAAEQARSPERRARLMTLHDAL